MSQSSERAQAATLPDDDVVGILLSQHARIQDLLTDVSASAGEHKQQAFDELRALLAAHETAEEMVVRPVSKRTAGKEVAEARNREEDEANHVLADLEKMDVTSTEFDATFARFAQSVLAHAQHEETMEFPSLMSEESAQDRQKMGRALKAAEKVAPTHPHPSTAGSPTAQWTVGPIASVIDRARDAVSAAMKH
ncbi:MAG: hemerythrin domain-containing protein [Motilibacteraceae bacterium]